MQTIRQFDHNDTDIFRHRKKHLAQILRLHLQTVCILVLRIFNIIRQMQMLQLGYTIHEKKDFIPEFLPHLFFGHHGIFQHIMQQTRSNGFLVQFQLCQNDCHTERMDNICLSGFTHLSFVRLKSDMICLFN